MSRGNEGRANGDRRARRSPAGRGFELCALESRLMLSTWYVDDSAGPGGGGATPSAAFRTIARGLDFARAGDTVVVLRGTYTENIIVGKAIRLQGAGPGLSIIRPDDDKRATVTLDFARRADSSARLVVTGFTIQEGPGWRSWPISIIDTANGILVQDCVIDASTRADRAVYVRGPANDVVFDGNVIRYRRIGVDFQNTTNLSDIVFTDSQFVLAPAAAGGPSTGIRIDGANDVDVLGNVWSAPPFTPTEASATQAMLARNVIDLNFESNRVVGVDRDTASTGLRIEGTSNATDIFNNQFINLRTGVDVTQGDRAGVDRMRIGRSGDGNVFVSTGTGILVTSGNARAIGNFDIAGNAFRDNDRAVTIGRRNAPSPAIAASTIRVTDNDFSTSNGVSISNFETNPATDRIDVNTNWFGDPSGPTHPDNPEGRGAVAIGLLDMSRLTGRDAREVDLSVQLSERGTTLSATPVPGDRKLVSVLVNNLGDGAARGLADFRVYLSPDATLDPATDAVIGERTFLVALGPARQRLFSVPVVVPDVEQGSYLLLAEVVPANMDETFEDNNSAASIMTYTVQRSFGNMDNGRGNVTMTLTNPATGSNVLLRLTGPGMATVDMDFNITVTGATERTTVLIRTPARETVALGNVDVAGAMGRFLAPQGDLRGAMTISDGGAGIIWLDTITAGNMTVAGRVNQLRVAEVTGGGTLTVDSLNVLNVTGRRGAAPLAGNFQATLIANNTQEQLQAIRLARVAGNAADGAIRVQAGSLGLVVVRGLMDNFDILVAGDIIRVFAGAMRDSAILAGSNADGTGLASDTGSRIGVLVVTGRAAVDGFSFINSVVGASTVRAARLVNVQADNAAGPPVNLLPGVANELGIFVTDATGVVVANPAGGRFQAFRQMSLNPALEPDFYVRQIE